VSQDFEQIFDAAPVSLWLENYSGLKRLFDQWRDQGVTDLAVFLAEDPTRQDQCVEQYKVLRVNQFTLDLFEACTLQELQSRLNEVLRDDIRSCVTHELCELWAGRMGFETQTFNYTLSGRRLEVRIRARILKGHEAHWDRVLLTLEDVTKEEESRQLLAEQQRYASSLFELSPVSLWVEDFSTIKTLLDEVRACGIDDFATFVQVHPEFVTRCMQEIRVMDVNRHTLQMFDATSKPQLIQRLDQVFRDEMHDSFKLQLIDLWHGKLFQQREVINHTLNGQLLYIHMQFHIMPGHEADWNRVLVSLVDISARKKAEAYLEYLGKHDVLTKLRNRAFFTEEVNRLSRKGPWPISVLAIDLNGLKQVNDEAGHAAGDAMLRRAGEVLSKAVDAPACACRIGGDEFVLLLPGSDARDASAVQDRIAQLLELNNQFYPGQALSLAVGSATCQAGEVLDYAVQAADQAMYQAKAVHYQQQAVERRHS
jgi:diguanylate cyclase (GGDEF)-like protein